MTTAERLTEVQLAISAVMKAQSYTFEGRQTTRADLDKLMQLEEYLEKKLDRESAGGRGLRTRRVSISHG